MNANAMRNAKVSSIESALILHASGEQWQEEDTPYIYRKKAAVHKYCKDYDLKVDEY